MGRGGKREAPAGSYLPNRADMRTTQPIQTAPGQPYGEAGAQQAQQAAMPLQNGGGAVAPGAAPAGAPPDPGLVAGGLGQSLFDPSQRPGEPVTHGAASGPGAGPEVLGVAPPIESPATTALRAAYSQFPVDGLREILENLDTQT